MQFFTCILLGFLVVCAISVSLSKNLLNSLLIYMSYSLVMSIIWIVLESPDLAITEAAVGAGVTSILFFVTLKKIHAIADEDADADEAGKTAASVNESVNEPVNESANESVNESGKKGVDASENTQIDEDVKKGNHLVRNGRIIGTETTADNRPDGRRRENEQEAL